jgi:AcrR family transcriptional regulator
MAKAPSNRRTRLTQAERSDAMRTRLLQATLDLIQEQGWAQTSTQKICARAGVSRGAQTHHFPTKESLLIAAVTEIVARHQQHMDEVLAQGDRDEPRLEYLFDFMWDACFEGNLLDCWIEAMVAARTDERLRRAVLATDRQSIQAMRDLGDACSLDGDNGVGDAADIVELTVYLLRGMVVQGGVHPNGQDRARLFDIWKKRVLTRP